MSRIQLVLAVSERTRLGVVIHAAPYASVRERFAEALFKALLHLDVPAELAAAEAQSMRDAEIAASNSRSVLGTLNQFGHEIECDLRFGEAESPVQLTQRLAETVVLSPKQIGFPADRVREAFGLPLLDFRARRGSPWIATADRRVGALNGGALTRAELCDPATNACSGAGLRVTARVSHSATVLRRQVHLYLVVRW